MGFFSNIGMWLTGSYVGKIIVSFVVSIVPMIELRGGLPIAIGLGLPFKTAFVCCIIGNLVPIIPTIIFIQRVYLWCRHKDGILRKCSVFLDNKVQQNRDLLDKYAWLGLLILTAIPLPGTGAWTASMIAGLTGIRIRYAFPAITIGVFIAGCIIGVLSYGVMALL